MNFSNQSGGVISILAWNLGNNVTASTASPSTTYSAPGVYIVTLTVTGPSGSDTKTDTVTVFDVPAVSFSATSLAGCAPHGTQFSSVVTSNAPGPVHYSWAFGDGTTDTAANPFHLYETPGTFTVSLTVSNGSGCSRTAVQNSYITVWPVPQISFVADQSQHCGSPATVNFSATASSGQAPYSYAWDFGDNSTSTSANPSHVYTGGSYSVQAVVTDNRGCKDTARIPNYIFVLGTQPTFTATTVCQDSATNFVNTTGSGGIAIWDYGDGLSDTNNVVNHTYENPGTYTVRMSVRIGNCVKVATKQVTVHPKATTTITMSPRLPCDPPQTITMTMTSDVPSTYAWSFLNGGSGTGSTAVKRYTAVAEDNFEVTSTTANGCVSRATLDTLIVRDLFQKLVTVNRLGGDDDTLGGGCAPHTVQFGQIKLRSSIPLTALPRDRIYPAGIVSYNWDFGDGTTSTQATPSHTYVNPARYKIRSIITTTNGCVDTSYDSIDVVNPIKPALAFSKDSICKSERFDLYNLTQNPPPDIWFSWSGGGIDIIHRGVGKIDTLFNVRSQLDTPYTIMLTTLYKGCRDSATASKMMYVKPPGANYTRVTECWPSTRVTFINLSRNADTLYWAFGDGTFDTAQNPVHYYPAGAGQYGATLYTENYTSGCKDTMLAGIPRAIAFKPPGFSATHPQKGCIGTPLLFSFNYMGASTDAYPWDVSIATAGDTTAFYRGSDALIYRYSKPGIHDVRYIFRYGSQPCYDTIFESQSVEISKPIVHFSANVIQGCDPLVVQLRDSSSNVIPNRPNNGWNWTYGDRDSLFDFLRNDTVTHIYDSTGRFSIKLFVIDSMGCTDSLERVQYVSVHKTVARFDSLAKGFGPDSACLGTPIQFRSASYGLTNLRLKWDFGDGTSDTANAPRHTYAARGRYPVRLIAIDSIGCADTIDRPTPINISMPIAGFRLSSNVAICPPLQVSIINSSTGRLQLPLDLVTAVPDPL